MLNPNTFRQLQDNAKYNFIKDFETKNGEFLGIISSKIIDNINHYENNLEVTYEGLRQVNISDKDFERYLLFKGFQVQRLSKYFEIQWFELNDIK